jgi:hypothetical protein
MKTSHYLKHTNDAEATLYQKQKRKEFETVELFTYSLGLFGFHARCRGSMQIYRRSFLTS